MAASQTLTSHLQSLSTPRPYSAAVEHDFLTAAGKRELSKPLLSLYLHQDRLYAAHSYPRFICRILAAIPYSSLHAPDSPQERLYAKVLKTLSYALQNVVREVNFFGDTARQYGLSTAWAERKQTRDYTAEMARVGVEGSFEEMLIFLWAMERLYLDAWSYAKCITPTVTNSPVGGALDNLIDNWTNAEFVQFVDDLADLVNSLDIPPGSEAWARAERIWARVIELEEAFWPTGIQDLAINSA